MDTHLAYVDRRHGKARDDEREVSRYPDHRVRGIHWTLINPAQWVRVDIRDDEQS
jgi:hypothetical protein